MKIRIIRTCGIQGRHVEAGTTIELPKQEALELITLRRAVTIGEEIETREPVVETREPSLAAETKKATRKTSKLP